jgi:hypothetical protein
MEASNLIRAIEAVILLAGLAGVFYAVFRARTTSDIIVNQGTLINTLKDRLDILQDENKELMHKHIENEKAIADLQGQIKVYKELPLQKLADNMDEITKTNKSILQLLKDRNL